MDRKQFLGTLGMLGTSLALSAKTAHAFPRTETLPGNGVKISAVRKGEDIFAYIQRQRGSFDLSLYRQILGACSAFKEGDLSLGVAATDETSRERARNLLAHTLVRDLDRQSVYEDALYELIRETTKNTSDTSFPNWTMGELKQFVIEQPEAKIKDIMPSLTSDTIGNLVKLMNNDELIGIGQKVFSPLPGSNIGSKGYLGARIQPNSPTDNEEDILWQVFDAWSFAVGDLVLGTNPVSSEVTSVAKIEKALYGVLEVFGLENVLPNCVLSHIDVQAEVEKLHPGTTGIWFQSLAGTVSANRTFDVSIEKMQAHMRGREGRYGLYAETGQGADYTNGHGHGFDMVLHESRKYGFIRALKQQLSLGKSEGDIPWVHVNDVAGFIGPEVFKTREQLVRCCLEDTVMGKLHGLTIGLDVCSTLHMDVSLEDLDWCLEQIMPANPAYLMALPTKNDPMLSYLTTSFSDHLRIRERFGYKVDDTMWGFFQRLGVIDAEGRPTEHFGDPLWVHYRYRRALGDDRHKEAIDAEGRKALERIRRRGVPIAEGHGAKYWEMEPDLQKEVTRLYEDAKVSLWTEMTPTFAATIPSGIHLATQSKDRKDYVYHPESGEVWGDEAVQSLQKLKKSWSGEIPDIQFLVSDGLNPRALMDENHLMPYLTGLQKILRDKGYSVARENIVIRHGRVRAGYAAGEILFGDQSGSTAVKGIVHIIGERPGSGHHNFSAYLTAVPMGTWSEHGKVDHNVSRVVSGISDTSLVPRQAIAQTVTILDRLFTVI